MFFLCYIHNVGSRVANDVYQLVSTLLVLRLLCLCLPLLFQLDFSPKVAVLSAPSEYKIGVESAAKFVNQLSHRYPSLLARLELGYTWLEAVDNLLRDCSL